MNRRQFLGTVASTALGSALARSQESAAAAASSLVRTPLVLMAPRPDGAEGVWGVKALCTGRMEWEGPDGATGSAGMDAFGFVPQGDNVLRVRLTGLRPGTAYRVRSVTKAAADGREEVSGWKPFRTLGPSSESTEFVVWNDTHINDVSIQKLHERTPKADFLLWNGDTCNDWTAPDLLVPTLLHPGQCDITDGRPLFVTWGNHDARGPYAFEMPRLTPTPTGRPFYAIRSGPVAALCLHTGEDKPDDHPSFQGRVSFDSLRREQAEWLADTVRSAGWRDAPYRLIFCHIPLRWLRETVPDYAKGGFDHVSLRSREMWHRALVEWKTQLVISGHTHRDASIAASEAFPYAQVTGGGPRPDTATWIRVRADAENLRLEVNDLEGKVRHALSWRPLV